MTGIQLYKHSSRIAAIVFVALTLTACHDNTVYNSYQHTNINGWGKGKELIYNIPPINESGVYRQSIGLRFTDLYPFQTLELVVRQTILPESKTFSDTLRYEVIDEQGKLAGNGLNISQFEATFKTLSLKKGDSIIISIHHNMRRDLLEGISDVGIKIETKE